MTANQINFAALQETKRSNRAKEDLTRTSNTINLEHYLRADEAAAKQADSAYINAVTGQRNADINAYNAQIAQQNADTNKYLAQVKQYEAEQHAREIGLHESLLPSQIALNEAKTKESLIGTWSSHPVTSAAKWVVDNAGKVVDGARTYAQSNPAATKRAAAVVTGTTASPIINAAARSLVTLPALTAPAGVKITQTRQGGRRNG